VHQLVGALHPGDAVGNEIRAIRDLLRAAGHASEIAAGWCDPRLAAEAVSLQGLEQAGLDEPEAVWLYHFSTGSPASGAALRVRGRLGLVYHNVTPARFFSRWSPEAARLAASAPAELRALAPRTALALAKSRFSLAELPAYGFERCALLPFVHQPKPLPALDRRAHAHAVAPVFARLYDDGRTNLLFVGRLAPNKRVLELVAAFAVLQRRLLPRSRLLLVGDTGLQSYANAVLDLARQLRLREVVLCGRVEEHELQAAYALADVFVSLSAHEGYGAPLVEAMLAGVPVVACEAGAVAETLDGAGILLGSARPSLVAGTVERLVNDDALRQAVVARQERLAARVRGMDYRQLVLESLGPLLGEAS
jgi:glycosyltransferase involved in cell wall biosynthesis